MSELLKQLQLAASKGLAPPQNWSSRAIDEIATIQRDLAADRAELALSRASAKLNFDAVTQLRNDLASSAAQYQAACDDAHRFASELETAKRELDAANAENAKLHAAWTSAVAQAMENGAKYNAIQSWKASVLAEVGPDPDLAPPVLDGWTYLIGQKDHYKRRAEHLASKLAEAQSWQERIQSLVAEQVMDVGLWVLLEDEYIQDALRQLHARIECGQPAPKGGDQPTAAITVQTVIDEMGNCADLCEQIADEKNDRRHTISYRAAAIRCRDQIHERMGAVRHSLSQKLPGEQS